MASINSRKVFLFFLVFFSIFFILSFSSNAAGQQYNEIYFLNKNNQKNKAIIGGESGPIYPGGRIEEDFKIVNENNFNCTIENFAVASVLEGPNGEVISEEDSRYENFHNNITIKLSLGDKILFEDKLLNFSNSKILKDKFDLPSNSKKDFRFTVLMDEEAESDISGLNYEFSLTGNFSAIKNGDNLPSTGKTIDFANLLIISLLSLAAGGFIVLRGKGAGDMK